MPDKDQVARLLAEAHRDLEPTIIRIVRLTSQRETDTNEPVKLLEVNTATSPSGIMPIAFSANPPDVPYPSIVVEVTEDEFEQISSGSVNLPNDWQLGAELYPAA